MKTSRSISLLRPDIKLRASGRLGFTMIEIAIALGVIGFALVVIIGVLPVGLSVQKEAHQDTTIGQDGPFFLDAIRSGAPNFGTNSQNLNFLTNYVDLILVSTSYTNSGGQPFTNDVLYETGSPALPILPLTNGQQMLGLLSTPEFLPDGIGGRNTNFVQAQFRGFSGNATEQSGGNTVVAFRYKMRVEVDRFNTFTPPPTNDVYATNLGASLQNNLYDVRLTFSWPVTPPVVTPSGISFGTLVGHGRETFRNMVSGQLLPYLNNTNSPLWYFRPNSYTTTPSPVL